MKAYEREIIKAGITNEEWIIRQLTLLYNKSLDDINEKIKALKVRYENEGLQSIIYQMDYQKALKTQIKGILDVLYADEHTKINEYLNICYEEGFLGTMYSLNKQGIPLIVPIDQEQAINAIVHQSKLSKSLYERLGEDVSLLKKKVSAEISRGIANNYSLADIARNLKNVSNIGINNALRIARTEGHRIQAQSQLDAAHKAKEKGADIVKQWDSTLDGRTRESHQHLDGQIRELDEPFEIGTHKALAPGQFGVPSEDVNCRCAMLQRARWALDEDELKTLQERAKYYGIDKTKDLDDFKKKYLKAVEEESKIEETPTNKYNFVEAKNIKEAEAYAKDVLGVSIANYKGSDILVANAMNEAFTNGLNYCEDIKERLNFVGITQERNRLLKGELEDWYYGYLKKQYPTMNESWWRKYAKSSASKTVGKVSSNNWATAFSGDCNTTYDDLRAMVKKYSGIGVNNKTAKNGSNFLEEIIYNIDIGYHPKGTNSIRSIFDHEIGHQLDYALGLSENKHIKALWKEITKDKIEEGLSRYGAKNIREFIAEAYCEYVNNPNPREIASKIGAIIEEEVKKRGR